MGRRNQGRKICNVAHNNKIIATSSAEAKWMSIELMGNRNIETIPLSLTCLLRGNKPDDREMFLEVVGKTKDRNSDTEEANKTQHDPASEHAKDMIQLFRQQMVKTVSDETMVKVNWETLEKLEREIQPPCPEHDQRHSPRPKNNTHESGQIT